ncbi:RloB domain-containing protein [Candidatus Saccharibacteria bacterium]|nr:RloB domain-containing protein [Candidatus Saccharibacteria bacterium]
MLYLAICTEGENSEPAFIRELDRAFSGQSINQSGASVAVVPVPLNGVHGHNKIIEAANEALDLGFQKRTDGPLCDFSNGDNLEKWLVCDYDYMEKHGVILEEFEIMVHEAGYELVINRPNFEFFVLALLAGLDVAVAESPSNYENAINAAAETINASNIEKGFSDGMMIPKYSKRHYAVPTFFGKLLDYNKDLVEGFCKIKFDKASERFTDMAKIINRIKELRNS